MINNTTGEISRLIQKILQENEIAPLEDGFYYYFPSRAGGGLNSNNLREIADYLDKINERRQKQLDDYFNNMEINEVFGI